MVKKLIRRHRNSEVPCCPFCKYPLVRVFGKGEIRCNHCNERLDRPVGSDSYDGRYVKCPYCGYEGEELIDPQKSTKCPRCGRYVLQTHSNF